MTALPRSAMVLAAGLGTRLRPVTETLPKPLIEINGRALLDHAIDRLAIAGVECVVVNVHYKAAMMRAHFAGREHPRIVLSEQDELLDTGGGVAQGLPFLGEVFFVVNGDVVCLDNGEPALSRLADAFDPVDTDAVLLLQRTLTAVGYAGDGDYFLDTGGIPRRRRGESPPRICLPASSCCTAGFLPIRRAGSFRSYGFSTAPKQPAACVRSSTMASGFTSARRRASQKPANALPRTSWF